MKNVLADIKRVYPGYDPKQGYELAGFVWFQGWNDMVNKDYTTHYAEHMAHFIRDVRKDLKVEGLPFIIGELGVGGLVRGDVGRPEPRGAVPGGSWGGLQRGAVVVHAARSAVCSGVPAGLDACVRQQRLLRALR